MQFLYFRGSLDESWVLNKVIYLDFGLPILLFTGGPIYCCITGEIFWCRMGISHVYIHIHRKERPNWNLLWDHFEGMAFSVMGRLTTFWKTITQFSYPIFFPDLHVALRSVEGQAITLLCLFNSENTDRT